MEIVYLTEKLKQPYKEAFERAHLYAVFESKIEQSIMEEAMLNLYDVFYTAQQEGKPLEKIIGEDIKQFCESYFEIESSKRWVENLSQTIIGFIKIFAWIEVCFTTIDIISRNNNTQSNLTPVLFGIVMGLIFPFVSRFLHRHLVENRRIKPSNFFIVIAILTIIFFIACIYLSKDILIYVPRMAVFVLSGLFLIAYYGYRYYRYGTFKKKDEEEIKKENKQLRNEVFNMQFEKGYIEYCLKKLQKNQIKGISSQKTYEQLQKRVKQDKYFLKFGIVIFLAIFIVAIIPVALKDPLFDLIIYTLIQFVTMGSVYLWFWKLTRKSIELRSKILKDAVNYQDNLSEYFSDQLSSLN